MAIYISVISIILVEKFTPKIAVLKFEKIIKNIWK